MVTVYVTLIICVSIVVIVAKTLNHKEKMKEGKSEKV